MDETEIKPIKFFHSLLLFGIPALLLWIATHYGIDYVYWFLGVNELLGWVITGGFVFILLFITALVGIKKEGFGLTISSIKKRFRLNPMTKLDWEWTFLGFTFVLVSSAVIVYFKYTLIHSIHAAPAFLQIRPLQPNEIWILGLWLVTFFFNILGEEFLWRGYILPRQQLQAGKYAWLVNGSLWTIFHLSFGIEQIINILPLLFVIPYVVQRRNNTWIGIIIHAAVNGPAFILITTGVYNLG